MSSLIIYESLNIFPFYIIYPWKPSHYISESELKKDYTSLQFTALPFLLLCEELVWHDICSGSMHAISSYTSSVILVSHGNNGSSASRIFFSTLLCRSMSDLQEILQRDAKCDGEEGKPSCAN